MTKCIAILTPVFDDWESLNTLLSEMDAALATIDTVVRVFIINDGSSRPSSGLVETCACLKHIQYVQIIHLVSNQGHQRAIAVGLAELVVHVTNLDAVIILDADGEDQPTDLPRLVAAHNQYPHHIIVARRQRRSEGFMFSLFYRLYKRLYQLLIGIRIDFGNYCLIPFHQAEKLAYNSYLWNHLAATIMRSRLPIMRVDTSRGQRYTGSSKMNLPGLVVHGLSAISVYSDIVFARALLFSFLMALASVVGIIVVVGVKLFTDLAIPGWATGAVGLLAILLIQAISLSAGAAFIMLHMRSQMGVVPAIDTLKFIKSNEVVHKK